MAKASLTFKEPGDAAAIEIGKLSGAAPCGHQLGGEVGERFKDVQVVNDRVEKFLGDELMFGLAGLFDQRERFKDREENIFGLAVDLLEIGGFAVDVG